MIKVHHAGKMGDVLYALPVMRALARTHRDTIHLTTSGLVVPLVPLLWEQPYIGDVHLDDTQPYEIVDFIFPNWEYYKPGEGYNLSCQPLYFEPTCPASWTHAAAWVVGIDKLEPEDFVALPSLVNHRRWCEGIRVTLNGQIKEPTHVAVVAPEVETLDMMLPRLWQTVIDALAQYGPVVVLGTKPEPTYNNCTDLRGLVTLPVSARLIAESSYFVGAHSLPWHLARHSETPAICYQTYRDGLYRCIPVDTPCNWIQPHNLDMVVDSIHNHFSHNEVQHGR
jgi:hypothetical protein